MRITGEYNTMENGAKRKRTKGRRGVGEKGVNDFSSEDRGSSASAFTCRREGRKHARGNGIVST
jgi:hypothetical protein